MLLGAPVLAAIWTGATAYSFPLLQRRVIGFLPILLNRLAPPEEKNGQKGGHGGQDPPLLLDGHGCAHHRGSGGGEGGTGREQEILRMLAEGRSNAEIAEHLVLAVHTVKTHVAHVLSKLQARDRTQAVILAYETGFVRPGDAAQG